MKLRGWFEVLKKLVKISIDCFSQRFSGIVIPDGVKEHWGLFTYLMGYNRDVMPTSR
jgi:hypothetical protein